eukprot:scaffold7079_cov154-Pinguiococcus_pyrenoidosus.AAC.2
MDACEHVLKSDSFCGIGEGRKERLALERSPAQMISYGDDQQQSVPLTTPVEITQKAPHLFEFCSEMSIQRQPTRKDKAAQLVVCAVDT